jgi:hypothetical protein
MNSADADAPQSDYVALASPAAPTAALAVGDNDAVHAPRSGAKPVRLRGKGRLYWMTVAWSLVWQIGLVVGALFARSPVHALALPVSVLFPRCAAMGGDVRSARLPKRAVVVAVMTASVARIVAASILSIVAGSTDLALRTEQDLLIPNAFGIFEATAQTKRFVLSVCVDVGFLVLCGIYLKPLVGWNAADAPEALNKMALTRSIMQWLVALAAGLASFALPSLRSLPLLLGHFAIVACIALKADTLLKWKVLHAGCQGLAVWSAALLVIDLGWQNTATNGVDAGIAHLRFGHWTEDSASVILGFKLLVRALSLNFTIWSCRRMHGTTWGLLTDNQARGISSSVIAASKTKRKSGILRRGSVARFLRWASQTFPLLLLPLMVFVVTVVLNLASFIVVLVTCFGFVATVDTFVRALPAMFLLMATVVTVSYAASVAGVIEPSFLTITGQEVTETEEGQTWQTLQLAIITGVTALWIVAFRLRRITAVKTRTTRKHHRKQLERALEKVGSDLAAIEDRFERFASPTAGVIRRGSLHEVLYELTHDRPTTVDVDQTWEYFTRAERSRQKLMVSVENLTRALSAWDDGQHISGSESEEDDNEDDEGDDVEDDDEATHHEDGDRSSNPGSTDRVSSLPPSPVARVDAEVADPSSRPSERGGDHGTLHLNSRTGAVLFDRASDLAGGGRSFGRVRGVSVTSRRLPSPDRDEDYVELACTRPSHVAAAFTDAALMSSTLADLICTHEESLRPRRIMQSEAEEPDTLILGAPTPSGNGDPGTSPSVVEAKPRPSSPKSPVFTQYPGRSRNAESVAETDLRDSIVFVNTQQPPSHVGIRFSDFILLHAAVTTHRMHNHNWFYALVHLVGQLILRHTTALTLLFMFFTATYGSSFDVMKMVFIGLFVAMLCSAHLRRNYWPVVIYYTGFVITALYAYRVIYRSQANAPTNLGQANAAVLGLRVVPVIELWINFALLALSVMELRVFAALQQDLSFARVLKEMEWRRLGNIPGAVAMQARVSLVVAGACFVIVGLAEPNSALVAGFLSSFGLVIVVGQHVPSARNFLWTLSTAYSTIALTLVALFQFDAVENWVQGLIGDGSMCKVAGKTPGECATDLGLNRSTSAKPLAFVLLPWFIACTANVVQLAMRLRSDEAGPIGDLSYDAYFTSQPVQLLLRFMAFSTVVGNLVLRFLSVHGPKVVWVGLVVAAVWDIRLCAAPYALLLVFDRRGAPVILTSAIHMAATYIYPLFFIPAVPGYTTRWAEYVGIYKSVEEGALASPVIAFASAVVYMASLSVERSAAIAQVTAAGHQRRELQRDRKAAFVSAAQSTSPKEFNGGRTFGDVELNTLQAPLLGSGNSSLASSHHSPNTNAAAGGSTDPARRVPGSTCQFCGAATCRGSCDVGCTLLAPLSIPQRLHQIVVSVRLAAFDTVGFELILLFLLIGMVLTCRRATAVVFFIFAVIMWVAGRFYVMTQRVMPTVLFGLSGLQFLWLVAVKIGLPPNADNVGPFGTHCSPWYQYIGCESPKTDAALAAVLMLLYRMCRIRVGARLHAWRYAGPFKTLGGFLRANRQAVEALLTFQRTDIDAVLPPPPPRDFLGDPHRVDEIVLSYFIAFFPVSVGSFFHGALTVNVVSVVEMLLGLFLIVYARNIYWHFPLYWRPVGAFYFGTILVQLVSNLPPVVDWANDDPSVAKSLGVVSWASDESSTFSVIVQVVVIWLVFVQHRIFNEPFFSLKLRSLYQGSVVSIRRHYEVMAYMAHRAQLEAEAVQTKEARLNEKLNAIRASRQRLRSHTIVPDVVVLGDGNSATQSPSPEYVKVAEVEDSTHAPRALRNNTMTQAQVEEALLGMAMAEAANAAREGPATPESHTRRNTTIEPEDRKARLAALRRLVEGWIDAAIVWMSDQSYRGHKPPSKLPRAQRLALATWNFALRRTMEMCLVIFTANFTSSGTLSDMAFCLVAVTYAMLLLPWPSERFWDILLAVNAFGIFVKSALRIVVEHVALDAPTESFIAVTFIDLGLNGRTTRSAATFIDIVMDFAVFGAILLHKQVCTDSGVYASRFASTDEAMDAAAKTAKGREELHASLPPAKLVSRGHTPSTTRSPEPEGGSRGPLHLTCPTQALNDERPTTSKQVEAEAGSKAEAGSNQTAPTIVTTSGPAHAALAAAEAEEAEEAAAAALVDGSDDEEPVVEAAAEVVSKWAELGKSVGGVVRGHASFLLKNVQERQGVGLDLYAFYLAIDFVTLIYVAAAYYGLVGRATGSFIDTCSRICFRAPWCSSSSSSCAFSSRIALSTSWAPCSPSSPYTSS